MDTDLAATAVRLWAMTSLMRLKTLGGWIGGHVGRIGRLDGRSEDRRATCRKLMGSLPPS